MLNRGQGRRGQPPLVQLNIGGSELTAEVQTNNLRAKYTFLI